MSARAYCSQPHPGSDQEADRWCEMYHRPPRPRPRGALVVVLAGSCAYKGHLAELTPEALVLEDPRTGVRRALRLSAVQTVSPIRSWS